jgi:hypothetical protein
VFVRHITQHFLPVLVTDLHNPFHANKGKKMNSTSYERIEDPQENGEGAKEVDSQPVPLRNGAGVGSLETVCTDVKSMRKGEDGRDSAQESEGEDCELIHDGVDVNVS